MSATGLVVLAAALVVTAAAAWWSRTRDGAVTGGPAPAGGGGDMSAQTVLARLGVHPEQADLTVVQFSTAFCGPCRSTRARLQHLQADRPGLAFHHVDAESHLDEVRALDVRRTPTLFYLDSSGALVGRSSGAPRPGELAALIDAHTAVQR